jgi:hypothetical protein
MADLGKLEVEVGADTTKLDRGIKSAGQSIKTFAKGLGGLTLSVGKYAAAMTAAGAAISGVFVRAQLDSIDALAKTADGLGITTQKLQALQHVGQLTGSTTEEINKSLARMERSLGEAARKGGNTALALDDLGVSIDEVIKMTPDKQLELLSAALVGVENQSVKASIANDVFGRSGLKMLKLMEELKDKGLTPAVKELEALGFSMNRVDAAKVEAANDSMLRFNKAIQSVFQRLTVHLAPILEGVSNEFLVMVKNAGGADKVMGDFVDSMVVGFGGVADAVTVVVRVIKAVVDEVMAVFNAVSSGFNNLKNFVGKFVDFQEENLGELGKLQKASGSIFDNLPSDKMKTFVDKVRKSSQEAAEAVASSVESTKRTGDFTATFFENKAAATSSAMNSELESFKTGLLNEEQAEIEHYNKRLEQLRTFIEAKRLTEEEAANARLTIEQQHQEALTEIQTRSAQERLSQITGAMQSQVSNISSAMQLITGSIGKESKKQFEITKVASIASALIKGYESVTSSFAAGARIGGPVLGAAFAATAAAATAAQIQSIRSQQFSGGGTVSNSGGVSGGVVAGGTAQQTQQQTSIHIRGLDRGSLYSGDQVNDLLDAINEKVADGSVLLSSEVIV